MKIIITSLLIAFINARATLIDLTLGGTVIDYGPPSYIAANNFYDEAMFNFPGWKNGWVSRYGILNGGQYFFTDLFSNPPSPTAQVSWDFGSTGYEMGYLDVTGANGLSNLYQVAGGSIIEQGVVTVNGQTDVTSISFYGVPDDLGSTALLLLIALLPIYDLARRLPRS